MKLPSKQQLIAQIKKNFWKRVSWLSFIFIVALLGDEYIKESYLFNPSDITNPFAHEFWIILSLALFIISIYKGGGRVEVFWKTRNLQR